MIPSCSLLIIEHPVFTFDAGDCCECVYYTHSNEEEQDITSEVKGGTTQDQPTHRPG